MRMPSALVAAHTAWATAAAAAVKISRARGSPWAAARARSTTSLLSELGVSRSSSSSPSPSLAAARSTSARAEAYWCRQPWPPHSHGGPLGSIPTWSRVAELPGPGCSGRPSCRIDSPIPASMCTVAHSPLSGCSPLQKLPSAAQAGSFALIEGMFRSRVISRSSAGPSAVRSWGRATPMPVAACAPASGRSVDSARWRASRTAPRSLGASSGTAIRACSAPVRSTAASDSRSASMVQPMAQRAWSFSRSSEARLPPLERANPLSTSSPSARRRLTA